MGEEAKSKIMEMPLQQRLKYGYKKVLDMLLVSGGISIVAVLLVILVQRLISLVPSREQLLHFSWL